MEKKEFKASDLLGIKDPSQILHYVRQWSSALTEEEHTARSVVQEIHQNLEIRLDRILYKLLTYRTPKGTTDADIDEAKQEIWKEIGSMGFEQKHRLLIGRLQWQHRHYLNKEAF